MYTHANTQTSYSIITLDYNIQPLGVLFRPQPLTPALVLMLQVSRICTVQSVNHRQQTVKTDSIKKLFWSYTYYISHIELQLGHNL